MAESAGHYNLETTPEAFAALPLAGNSSAGAGLAPSEVRPPLGLSSSGHLLLLFALLVLINLIVICGNVLVILAVYLSAKLRSVTNIFIVSLATADLMLGIFVLPYALLFEITDVWMFGEIWCRGWLVTDVWISTASILNLCAISVDRYVAVTRPVKYRSIMTSRRAKTIVAFVWIVSFLICFPPLLPKWKPSSSSPLAQSNYAKNIHHNHQQPPPTTTTTSGRFRRSAAVAAAGPPTAAETAGPSAAGPNGGAGANREDWLKVARPLLLSSWPSEGPAALRDDQGSGLARHDEPGDTLGATVLGPGEPTNDPATGAGQRSARPRSTSMAANGNANNNHGRPNNNNKGRPHRASRRVANISGVPVGDFGDEMAPTASGTITEIDSNELPVCQCCHNHCRAGLLGPAPSWAKAGPPIGDISSRLLARLSSSSERQPSTSLGAFIVSANGNHRSGAGPTAISRLPPLLERILAVKGRAGRSHRKFRHRHRPRHRAPPKVSSPKSVMSELNPSAAPTPVAPPQDFASTRGPTPLRAASLRWPAPPPLPLERAKVGPTKGARSKDGQREIGRPEGNILKTIELLLSLLTGCPRRAASRQVPTANCSGRLMALAGGFPLASPEHSRLSQQEQEQQQQQPRRNDATQRSSQLLVMSLVGPARWRQMAIGCGQIECEPGLSLESGRDRDSPHPPRAGPTKGAHTQTKASISWGELANCASVSPAKRPLPSGGWQRIDYAPDKAFLIPPLAPSSGCNDTNKPTTTTTTKTTDKGPANDGPAYGCISVRCGCCCCRRRCCCCWGPECKRAASNTQRDTSKDKQGRPQKGPNARRKRSQPREAKRAQKAGLSWPPPQSPPEADRSRAQAAAQGSHQRQMDSPAVAAAAADAEQQPGLRLSSERGQREHQEAPKRASVINGTRIGAGKTGCALFDDKPYVIYSALGSFYIPMLIMIFFYSRIYLVASRAQKALQRGYMTTKWSPRHMRAPASVAAPKEPAKPAAHISDKAQPIPVLAAANNGAPSSAQVNSSPAQGPTWLAKSGGPTQDDADDDADESPQLVTLRIHRREKQPPNPVPATATQRQSTTAAAVAADFDEAGQRCASAQIGSQPESAEEHPNAPELQGRLNEEAQKQSSNWRPTNHNQQPTEPAPVCAAAAAPAAKPAETTTTPTRQPLRRHHHHRHHCRGGRHHGHHSNHQHQHRNRQADSRQSNTRAGAERTEGGPCRRPASARLDDDDGADRDADDAKVLSPGGHLGGLWARLDGASSALSENSVNSVQITISQFEDDRDGDGQLRRVDLLAAKTGDTTTGKDSSGEQNKSERSRSVDVCLVSQRPAADVAHRDEQPAELARPDDQLGRPDRSQSCCGAGETTATPAIVVSWNAETAEHSSQLLLAGGGSCPKPAHNRRRAKKGGRIREEEPTVQQGVGGLVASLPQAAHQVRKQSMMLLSSLTSRSSETLRRLSMVASHPVDSLLANLNRSRSNTIDRSSSSPSFSCSSSSSLSEGAGQMAEANGRLTCREPDCDHRQCRSRAASPRAHTGRRTKSRRVERAAKSGAGQKKTLDDYLMAVAGIDSSGSSDFDAMDDDDEDDDYGEDDDDDEDGSRNLDSYANNNNDDNVDDKAANNSRGGQARYSLFLTRAASSRQPSGESGPAEVEETAAAADSAKCEVAERGENLQFGPTNRAADAQLTGAAQPDEQRPARSALQRQGAYYERATSRDGQQQQQQQSVKTEPGKGLLVVAKTATGSGAGEQRGSLTAVTKVIRSSFNSAKAPENSLRISFGGGGRNQLANRNRRRGAKRTSRWHAKRLHAETKAAKTVAIIIGGFIFCWLPFFTAYLSRAIICERPDCVPQSLLSLFIWLGYLNSAINPVIYGLFSADFRHAFKNIVCRCRFRGTEEPATVSILVDSIINSIL